MKPQASRTRGVGHAPRTRAAGTYRTGPLGRLARLVLAAGLGLSLASVLDQGGAAGFRRPSVLAEPSVWLLDGAMLAVFVLLVGRLAAALAGEGAARRWQLGALVALAAAVAAAALVGRVFFGAVWGFPLADLVWAFDALMLLQTVVALLLTAALGTPGCEIGVWPELIARARGGRAAPAAGLACVVGLRFVDEWEARRRADARPAVENPARGSSQR